MVQGPAVQPFHDTGLPAKVIFGSGAILHGGDRALISECREGMDRVAELVPTTSYETPAALEASGLRQLLKDAYEGRLPE